MKQYDGKYSVARAVKEQQGNSINQFANIRVSYWKTHAAATDVALMMWW